MTEPPRQFPVSQDLRGSRDGFAINTQLLRLHCEKHIGQANSTLDLQQRKGYFNQAAWYLSRALELEHAPAGDSHHAVAWSTAAGCPVCGWRPGFDGR